jgi:hypothetical protein
VDPAGAVIVSPEASHSLAPSTVNTLKPGPVPVRAIAQVEPVGVYVVVPVAARDAQASLRPVRYASAAAKSIGASFRTVPFGSPTEVRFAVVP